MSKINSYWDFERELEGFEEVNLPYEIPPHNSKNFIDFDFIRELLFILSEAQKGVEILMEPQKFDDMKESFVNMFHLHLSYSSKDIIRICFDFENNVIMIKSKQGEETNIYFLHLEEHKDKIIETMNLVIEDMGDINDHINAMLLLSAFESWTQEEKLEFMGDYIRLKDDVDNFDKHLQELKQTLNMIKHK